MKSIVFTASVTICISALLFSCNSPAKRGKKFAAEENKICANAQEKLDKLVDSYTTEFQPEQYSLRQEAKDAWLSQHEDIVRLTNESLNETNDEKKAYMSDLSIGELKDFREAFRKNLEVTQNDELLQRLNNSEIPQEVLHSIAKIKPQKPNEAQMAKDLEKYSLIDVEGGYYYEVNKTIQIGDYDVTDFKVNEVMANSTSEYSVKASMSLLGKVNRERRIDVQCTIRYFLPEYDDWSIDFIKTESLTPVSAEAYNGCVKTTVQGGWLGQDLYVKNECSKSLEVFVRYYKYGRWYKSVVVAKPQEDTFVSYGEPDESKIDYVLPL